MYAVVNFTEDNSVEVIPSNWLEKCETSCLWPPIKSTTFIAKMAKNRQPPSFNWISFNARVLEKTETYEGARSLLKKAEFTSDLQSEDNNNSLKRKIKPPKKYDISTSISSGSDETDICFSDIIPATQAPKFRKIIQMKSAPVIAEPIKKSQKIMQERDAHTESVITGYLRKSITIMEEIKTTTQNNNKLLLQLVQQQEDKHITDDDMSLPLNSIEDLMEMEEMLSADDSMKNSIYSKIMMIGGISVQNAVTRTLNMLIGQDLATKLNWHGKGNLSKFAFGETLLAKLVCKYLRRVSICKDLTESDFKKFGSAWLRNATDRNGGRNKRKLIKKNVLPASQKVCK